ncbi:MAG TPA: PilZ domain-containing protein [Candidatus Sulfotelmatobacter sp.]
MQAAADARRHPRFKLEVELRIYARNSPVVRGHTVDISESGISAMLKVEVPLEAVVRLEFDVALGSVEVPAVVRQRNAFRYGFQFVEASPAREIIGRTCGQLALQQSPPLPSRDGKLL